VELKDNMGYEDFAREFNKFTAKGPLGSMRFQENAVNLLHQPFAQYAFEPYDKAFPAALSTGKEVP
jgi:hypothetical protein